MDDQLERNVLEYFFICITTMNQSDNPIDEVKIIRETQNKLKIQLRNNLHRCTCARRSYDMCEVCQASDSELVTLRNFYNVIRNLKKYNWSEKELNEFIENTKKRLNFT